ncbi:hypothetical protein ZIOFF_019092 [Zingiber officinale]|uniref:Uncharacterized protein n=2 Tax=Magnoliopsida TaxID=3398 RepID=A0A8J5HLK0_ZINOF|nr:hypothetical protein ZIOFF_019092 [Zingiber officinale]
MNIFRKKPSAKGKNQEKTSSMIYILSRHTGIGRCSKDEQKRNGSCDTRCRKRDSFIAAGGPLQEKKLVAEIKKTAQTGNEASFFLLISRHFIIFCSQMPHNNIVRLLIIKNEDWMPPLSSTCITLQAATRILARQLVRLRQQITNLQGTRAQIRGIATHTQAMYASTSISTGMKGASKAMAAMNKYQCSYLLGCTVSANATSKAGKSNERVSEAINTIGYDGMVNSIPMFIEICVYCPQICTEKHKYVLVVKIEMMSEAIDETLDKDEAEEETEELTNQVLDEIGVDVASQLSSAPKGRIAVNNKKVDTASRHVAPEKPEVDELEKRLASLRRI